MWTQNSLPQPLMMETEAVSEMADIISPLTWLITWEDFTVDIVTSMWFSSLYYSLFLDYILWQYYPNICYVPASEVKIRVVWFSKIHGVAIQNIAVWRWLLCEPETHNIKVYSKSVLQKLCISFFKFWEFLMTTVFLKSVRVVSLHIWNRIF